MTVFYRDGEKFARVYTDREKATSFAKRQKRSPVVKSARVVQVSYTPRGMQRSGGTLRRAECARCACPAMDGVL